MSGLNRARAVIEKAMRAFLTDRCDIYDAQSSVTSIGSVSGGSVLLARDVPCRLIRIGASQANQAEWPGEQETIVERYRLIIPCRSSEYDFELYADQEVEIDGERFQIAAIAQRLSHAVDRQCIVTKMV